MNCPEVQALKHGYADGELDLVRNVEIEKHLAGCAACARAFENVRLVKSAVAGRNGRISGVVASRAFISKLRLAARNTPISHKRFLLAFERDVN